MYTPPATDYLSSEILERQKKLFANSWQWIPAPAIDTLSPFTLLPQFLDAHLLLLSEQREYALSNVCTHRGALLYQASCKVPTTLRCPYHGRSFDKGGKCLAMPGFEKVSSFPTPQDHLPRKELKTWHFLRFVALQTPFVDFETFVASLDERLGFLPLDTFQFSEAHSRDYDLAAHWMLYCDNYLEGLHIPYVHPALLRALNFKAYETHTLPHGVLQIGLAEDDEVAFELPPDHPDTGKRVAAFYFWLFPNLMLNFYPWGLSLNVVEPRGLESTRVRYLSWISRPELMSTGAGADVDTTEREDHEVVLRVQQGLKSPLYHRGRYAPDMEKGVAHFHHLRKRYETQDV